MTVAIVKHLNKPPPLSHFEDPGMPRRRIRGGYIDDLAALGKCLLFCGLCIRKFQPASYGYVMKRHMLHARGKCDGCDQNDTCYLLLHQNHHDGWDGNTDV